MDNWQFAGPWLAFLEAGPSASQNVDDLSAEVSADPASDVVRQTRTDSRHLSRPAPTLELHRDLDHLRDAGGAEGVTASDQPTAGVDRHPATQPGDPVEDQTLRLVLGTETQFRIGVQLADGRQVVHFGHPDVLRTESGQLVRLAGEGPGRVPDVQVVTPAGSQHGSDDCRLHPSPAREV